MEDERSREVILVHSLPASQEQNWAIISLLS